MQMFQVFGVKNVKGINKKARKQTYGLKIWIICLSYKLFVIINYQSVKAIFFIIRINRWWETTDQSCWARHLCASLTAVSGLLYGLSWSGLIDYDKVIDNEKVFATDQSCWARHLCASLTAVSGLLYGLSWSGLIDYDKVIDNEKVFATDQSCWARHLCASLTAVSGLLYGLSWSGLIDYDKVIDNEKVFATDQSCWARHLCASLTAVSGLLYGLSWSGLIDYDKVIKIMRKCLLLTSLAEPDTSVPPWRPCQGYYTASAPPGSSPQVTWETRRAGCYCSHRWTFSLPPEGTSSGGLTVWKNNTSHKLIRISKPGTHANSKSLAQGQ